MGGGLGRLVVVILVGLAGCSSALGGSVTTTSTPTPEHRVAAPGITTDGVVAPNRLAAAHVASLSNRSYTLTSTLSIHDADGVRRGLVVRRLRMGSDHERFRYEKRVVGEVPMAIRDGPDVRAWSDGTRTYVANTRGDRTWYLRRDRFAPRSHLFDGNEAIRIYLGLLNRTSVRQVEHDGWIAYRISAVNRMGVEDPDDDVEVTALVDTFGRLYAFRATVSTTAITIIDGGGSLRRTVRFTAVGSTTIERPAWVDAAETALNSTADPG